MHLGSVDDMLFIRHVPVDIVSPRSPVTLATPSLSPVDRQQGGVTSCWVHVHGVNLASCWACCSYSWRVASSSGAAHQRHGARRHGRWRLALFKAPISSMKWVLVTGLFFFSWSHLISLLFGVLHPCHFVLNSDPKIFFFYESLTDPAYI